MTQPEADAVKRRIADAYSATVLAWGEGLNALGGLHETTALLAQAATLISDAQVAINHPGLKRRDCLTSDADSFRHAVGSQKRMYSTLCGAKLKMESRIVPDFRVPTCPKCIAILTGKESQDV